MIIESSAPTRCDLAGGTIDIWPLYLFHAGASTVNFALSLRARVRIETRSDRHIILESRDRKVLVETTVDQIDNLARDEKLVAARITVNYHGVHFHFTTRNPKERPRWMAIHLEQGPFRRFEGEWNLTELSPAACKIAFTLRYELRSDLLGKLAGRVFDGIANTLVDAYARRAEQIPAGRPSALDSPTNGDAS